MFGPSGAYALQDSIFIVIPSEFEDLYEYE